jgi:hypothetical protein
LEDKELQQFYEQRFDLFMQLGWKDLVEDFQELAKQIGDITKCNDEADLWYKRGQLEMINYIVNLQELTERAFEELDEDSE